MELFESIEGTLCLLLAVGGVKASPLPAMLAETNRGRARISKAISSVVAFVGLWCAGVRDIEVLVATAWAAQELGHASYKGTIKGTKTAEVVEGLADKVTGRSTPVHADI